MRTTSRGSFDLNSLSIKNSRNFNFFEDDLSCNQSSNLPSPIHKMKFDSSSNVTKDDILNYSRETLYNQKLNHYNKSCNQSPVKQSTNNNHRYFQAEDKQKVPQYRILNDNQWNRGQIQPTHFKKQQTTTFYKQDKQNKANKYEKVQNQEDNYKSSDSNRYDQPKTFYSQKTIQFPAQTFRNNIQGQRYDALAANFQQLQRDWQKIKDENMRLKKNRDQLMNENINLKKHSQHEFDGLCGQIQNLKQKIYRMQMDRQSSNTNRNGNSRMSMGTISSARGFNQNQQNEKMNPFYIDQLERQNDQLIRQNRRLNQIVMKRLKHSVAQ